MKNKIKDIFSTKYMLSFLTIICAVLIVITFFTDKATKPIKNALSYVIIPLQSGVNDMGLWLFDNEQHFKSKEQLAAENAELRAQLDIITEQYNKVIQDGYEIERLRDLYELDSEYEEYKKVGARVIAKESGNWFHSFTIDKGSNHGIKKDMNVIAKGGLVGIVTDVGPNYSIVRSIIDDTNYVSGMVINTGEICAVKGNMKLYSKGLIEVSNFKSTALVKDGDCIVTSNISDKYLPGILIGYIKNVKVDANNLTQSGYITPAVDFEHIQEVLIITDLKE